MGLVGQDAKPMHLRQMQPSSSPSEPLSEPAASRYAISYRPDVVGEHRIQAVPDMLLLHQKELGLGSADLENPR